MKQKLMCVINAAVAAVLILIIVNFIWINGQEEKVVPASVKSVSQSEEVIKEYIYENYVISEKNPWTDYGLNPVEYKEVSETEVYSESVDAKAAILVDVNEGQILYEKNSDEKMHPASTTKLMTALTALQILDTDDIVTIGKEVDMIATDSSRAGFSKGQIVTVRELLEGLLISSGNDAAYVLAKAAGEAIFEDNIAYEGERFSSEQCVERFILEMNKNVRDMELENTNFTTPDGYDAEGQYTTASDLAKIATEAYDNEIIREICGLSSKYSETLGKTWTSTNELMNKESNFYYKYCMGMKTGTTDLAGKCLVSVAEKDDETCICVVLNEETEEGRWEDSVKLLKFGVE